MTSKETPKHRNYSLDSLPPDVILAVAGLALEAGELAELVARLALQALGLNHLEGKKDHSSKHDTEHRITP